MSQHNNETNGYAIESSSLKKLPCENGLNNHTGTNGKISHLNGDSHASRSNGESIQNGVQFDNELMWSNSNKAEASKTSISKFQKKIEDKYNLKFNSYAEFYQWSIDSNIDFWREFWHFSGLKYSKIYDEVLDTKKKFDEIPEWFHGSRLNYAENLLKFSDDRVAVFSTGEGFSEVRSLTFAELSEQVKRFQYALKRFGIQKGDRVVGYMPNCVECLEALLATASLGAIWSCASPDFGSASVIDRFSQIEPKVLFSVASVVYNGKKHDHTAKLNEVLAKTPSIEKVVIVPFLSEVTADAISTIPKGELLSDFLGSEDLKDLSPIYEQVPFNHPLAILYSSGTTGAPKCIVHSHGGTLIQHMKEHILQGNVQPGDTMLYYTTTGWMMYNWLISSLAIGASIVLYDGSPILPKTDALWDLVDQLKITMFGTSAKWLSLMEERKIVPMQTHKLDTLKAIYSTGSPLKPNSFQYVYKCIKKDVLLGSITGGTDIISLFCGHHVNLPVYKGEIQCRHLGMAVECWIDENNRNVFDKCGELVCTKPFPSMPVFFWKDPDHKKYHASYFEKFDGVWAHGDFCVINKSTGGVVMLGRSDGTLNPNGVRFGSAEIYNIVECFEEISDSLCVAQRNPKSIDEERVILFVKVAPSSNFDDTLVKKLKDKIRNILSARHVPSLILAVPEIPYTLNGKKLEVPVRRLIEGNTNISMSSVANIQALEYFKHIEELKHW